MKKYCYSLNYVCFQWKISVGLEYEFLKQTKSNSISKYIGSIILTDIILILKILNILAQVVWEAPQLPSTPYLSLPLPILSPHPHYRGNPDHTSTVLLTIVQYYPLQYSIAHYSTVLLTTVQYYLLEYSITHYSTVLLTIVQYYSLE